MENLIKNVYTAYRIDNSIGYGNYISVKTSVPKNGVFAMDMWLYIEDDGSELISQQDGFCLGISKDKIMIKMPGMEKVTIGNIIIPIREKEWINLYIGYDKKNLTAFVNGNSVGEVEFSGNFINENPFMIGKEFSGYIRSLRLYNQALTEKQFRNYFMASSYKNSMKELESFIDFTKQQITDLTEKTVDVQIYGGCTFMDLVDVYCPSTGDFTYFTNPDEINPGGFETKAFSIYVKQYIRPSAKQRQIVYINGEWNENDNITLLSEKKNEKTDFVFRAGGEEYSLGGSIPDYAWVDVLICVSEKTVIAYINGEKKEIPLKAACHRNRGGNFRIGGCQNAAEMICENYIHTVAVFNRLLGDGDAADFLKNHPFIFEDGLIALVSFEGGKALELSYGAEIKAGEKGLFPAQRTVPELPDEEYRFRLNYTQKAHSDMKLWEAEQIVAGYKNFASSMSGCEAGASSEILETVTRYVSNHEEILQKESGLYTKSLIEPVDAVSSIGKTDMGVIKSLLKTMQLFEATTALGGSAAVVGEASVSSTAHMYEALFVSGCAVAVATAGAIAAVVNEQHKEKPDHDDDDKDDISVKILSITLQHNPDDFHSSAIRCRNYKGTVTGPEWTNKEKCVAPALYIANQLEKVKIQVKYVITDNSKQKKTPYTVSISASVSEGEKKLFDNFTIKADGLKEGVEYEALAESAISASADKSIYFSQITLWWSGSVNGKNIALPNSKLDIYIIPKIPASPILIDKNCDTYFPAIEYLKIYTQMLGEEESGSEIVGLKNVDPITNIQEHVRYITHLIYYSPCFEYYGAPTPRYVVKRSDITTGTPIIEFHQDNFLADVKEYERKKESVLKIECEVYASILGYYLNMLGISFSFALILNPVEDKHLHTNNLYAAGHLESPEEKIFNYHFVVSVPVPKETEDEVTKLIYDASLGQMQDNMIKPITGVEFCHDSSSPYCNTVVDGGKYRGIVFKDGTGALIQPTNYSFIIT